MNLLYWQVTCEAFNTPEGGIGGSSKPVTQVIIPSSTSSKSMTVLPKKRKRQFSLHSMKLGSGTIELLGSLNVGQVLVELNCSGIWDLKSVKLMG